MSIASKTDTRFIDPEVVSEKEEARIKKAQKKEESLRTWKVYLPMSLFIVSFCAAFYASVVGSGSIALVAIVAFLASIGLSIYFGKKLFNDLIS